MLGESWIVTQIHRTVTLYLFVVSVQIKSTFIRHHGIDKRDKELSSIGPAIYQGMTSLGVGPVGRVRSLIALHVSVE